MKQFRQWGSSTPGHPENFETPGVEVTTGLFSSIYKADTCKFPCCTVKLKVSVSDMVVLQDLLVRVSPMLLGWHLLRSTWLPASTSLTVRLSTTTRNNSTVNVPCFAFSLCGAVLVRCFMNFVQVRYFGRWLPNGGCCQ